MERMNDECTTRRPDSRLGDAKCAARTDAHWDPQVVEQSGYGRHTINQGPLGLSYMVNMLHAWAGHTSIRRIVMRFPYAVLDGDHITAKGEVVTVRNDNGETLADCRIWLERPGTEAPLEGTATVALSSEGE